ncbi:MAG: glutamate 5-kinase [Clostridiales bacterium]|jgi:glutamate 5-kinase|nr:glutamate 5-kinase [Clostridiales bacterium]
MDSNAIKNRIVVKVGTSTLTHEGGKLNFRSFDALARVLSDIHNMGSEIILVSSGAIAVGAGKLQMKERPSELSLKQAAAAVGQCELMHLYDKFFGDYGKIVAQILLTGDDVDSPEKKQNLINTFSSLLELGIIPIVNENDSLSHAEIEAENEEHKIFGDNDTLSAVVAVLCGADKLVLLSDIDGLYDGNPNDKPEPRLIREVRVIDEEIRALAGGAGSRRGTGGMITKLQAAELATKNGIDMYIANGQKPETLYDIVNGNPAGTLFVGKRGRNDRT